MTTVLRTTRALTSWITGRSAVEEYETVLSRGDREVPASVILPAGGRRTLPGWVVLHGVTRPGRFHPTLLRFVRALASSKAAVLVPQIPEWVDLSLEPERTLPTVQAALDGLRSLPGTSDGPYGLIGFSFGAPQAMIAAAHQDVSEQLAGVVGFGSYFDVASMVRFQMTGRFDLGDATHRLRPDPYGRWIMGWNHLTSIPEYQNAQDVADAVDDIQGFHSISEPVVVLLCTEMEFPDRVDVKPLIAQAMMPTGDLPIVGECIVPVAGLVDPSSRRQTCPHGDTDGTVGVGRIEASTTFGQPIQVRRLRDPAVTA